MGRKSSFNQQQVLADALDLFWSRGFASSSLKHLETVTDMHPGSLYYHFKNKEQLYLATLEYYLEWFLQPRINKYLTYTSHPDGLRRFFTSGYRHDQETQFRNCCFIISASNELHLLPDKADQLIQDALVSLHHGFHNYLEQAINNHNMPATINAEQVSSELLNLYLSLQLRARVAPNQRLLDKQVKQSLTYLLPEITDE